MANKLSPPNRAGRGFHSQRWAAPRLGVLAAALFSSAGATACGYYDAPPEPRIVDLDEGKLSDPTKPLVLTFNEPFKPDTLKVKIAKYAVDAEGLLLDDDDDANTNLELIFSHEPAKDELGVGEVLDGNRTLRITPTPPMPGEPPFPVGKQLIMIIEPGLSDVEGNATAVRKTILFSYGVAVTCGQPITLITGGYTFYLFEFQKPVATQAQLWSRLSLNPATGAFTSTFTNADRNPDPNRCNPPCSGNNVCRLLPMQACVPASEAAASVDEYSDFVVNSTPPTGFVFNVTGCMREDAGKVYYLTDPYELKVESPPITLVGGVTSGTITVDGNGVERTEASSTAEDVILGMTSSGKGEALVFGRGIPDGEEPVGVPEPPPLP